MKMRELIDQMIDERVEMILKTRTEDQKRFREMEEAVLASLDDEARRKVEDLLGEKYVSVFEDYRKIYLTGFLDGLRMGHTVF